MIRNREELKKEFYLVCPVRDASSTALAFLENYVDNFEKSHVGVYYPKWDTTQEGDSIGLKICTDNLNGIKNSKYAKAFLSRTSEGSLFDLGMIFFLDKIVEVINPGVIENLKTHTKQFITNYAINYSERRGSKIYDAILERKQKISDAEFLGIYFNGKTPEFLFDFGMIFASGKSILLENRTSVKETNHKSFENVLIELDRQTREKFNSQNAIH